MFVSPFRPMSQALLRSHHHTLSRTFYTCTSHKTRISPHLTSPCTSRVPSTHISTYTTLCSSPSPSPSPSLSSSSSSSSSPSSLRHFSTIPQLLRGCREPRRYKNKRRYLEGAPQRKATVLKVFTMTPRKPNSAIRKVARIGIIGRRIKRTKVRPIFRITAYIPGAGHTLVKHNSVLVRGGRTVDLPGLKYKLIRGATGSGRIKNRKKRARYDLPAVLGLKNARSKYGVKRVKE